MSASDTNGVNVVDEGSTIGVRRRPPTVASHACFSSLAWSWVRSGRPSVITPVGMADSSKYRPANSSAADEACRAAAAVGYQPSADHLTGAPVQSHVQHL